MFWLCWAEMTTWPVLHAKFMWESFKCFDFHPSMGLTLHRQKTHTSCKKMWHCKLTVDCDADDVAALPTLRLAPVQSTVCSVDSSNGADGPIQPTPAGPTLKRRPRGSVSLHLPVAGVPRRCTAQREVLVSKELSSVRMDAQCSYCGFR